MVQRSPSPQRRREGFPGQHLVVLPSPRISEIRTDPLLRDLFPTAAGRFPRAAGHYVQRRIGIDDFILIHVLEGHGWVQTDHRHQLGAGQFFLLRPGVMHSYGADNEDPWAVQWIHFQGASAGASADLFGSGSLQLYDGRVENLHFSRVYGPLESGYIRSNLLLAAANLRTILAELHIQAASAGLRDARTSIQQSLAWMHQHLHERVSLADLAHRAGLSVPHYSALFKQSTGVPPMEHFLRLKIQHACRLLDTTELRISEIASETGWDDPFYFSRFFRRITGKSPRAYRAVAKG